MSPSLQGYNKSNKLKVYPLLKLRLAFATEYLKVNHAQLQLRSLLSNANSQNIVIEKPKSLKRKSSLIILNMHVKNISSNWSNLIIPWQVWRKQ